jgi:hypothetical protein
LNFFILFFLILPQNNGGYTLQFYVMPVLKCLIENSVSTALRLFVIMYCVWFIVSYAGQSGARERERRERERERERERLTGWANPRQENIFVARRNTDERD